MTQPCPISRPQRVCYPFIGNNVGGSHISTLLLVKNLDRSRVEPIVVLHEEGLLSDYLRQQNLDYELLANPDFLKPPFLSFRNIATLLPRIWRLTTFLRRRQIDIVHVNDTRIQFGWSPAARLAGTKLIWHQRTGNFGRSLTKLVLARMAHQLIGISRYSASTLPELLKPHVQVVANPFDTEFAAVERGAEKRKVIAELGLAPDAQLVGFFGNLVQQKRPAIFLSAASLIDRRIEGPLHFLLCGAERDNARSELTDLAQELGIADRVHLMGFRTPVEPLMAACDVIIAPGIGEGLGRSLIEATIVGTPVVAADSGGHREVIVDGETGFLVAPDDPQAFAAAACKLLSDMPLAAGIAARAQAVAIREYSIEGHAEVMTEVYRRVLAKGPCTACVPAGKGSGSDSLEKSQL